MHRFLSSSIHFLLSDESTPPEFLTEPYIRFWRNYEDPVMADLALRLGSFSATSCDLERLFSILKLNEFCNISVPNLNNRVKVQYFSKNSIPVDSLSFHSK